MIFDHSLAFQRCQTILPKVSFPLAGQSFLLSNDVIFDHCFETYSGLIVFGSKKTPSVLCHLSLATNPPPTQKTLPFSVQLSWQRQATKGTTRLGLTSLRISGGITVSNIREAAKGAMVLTLIFLFSPSLAKAWVKPCRANLAAEQFTCPKLPKSPAAEEVLTMRPYPCSRITFHAARLHLQAPQTWTLKIKFQSSSFIFWNEISLKIPALLSRTSTLPKLSIAVLMILSPNQTESQLATATPPLALISSTTLSAALLLLP